MNVDIFLTDPTMKVAFAGFGSGLYTGNVHAPSLAYHQSGAGGAVRKALSNVHPHLTAANGAGVGTALGAIGGAIDPGRDEDGDRRSMLGGMLRGATSGAVIGGVGGAAARRISAPILNQTRHMGDAKLQQGTQKALAEQAARDAAAKKKKPPKAPQDPPPHWNPVYEGNANEAQFKQLHAMAARDPALAAALQHVERGGTDRNAFDLVHHNLAHLVGGGQAADHVMNNTFNAGYGRAKVSGLRAVRI